MRKNAMRSWTAVLFGFMIAATATAMGADRSAKEILKDLDAIKMPTFEPARRSEPGYVQNLQRQMMEAGAKQDVLIPELFKVDPDNDRLPALMSAHWMRMPPVGPNASKLTQELDDALARTHNEKLKAEVYFARARIAIVKGQQTGNLDLSAVDEFVKKAPKDDRCPQLLYIASMYTKDEDAKKSIEDRMLKDYPQSRFAEPIRGSRRMREAVGKPFDLEFTDAISGSTISMKNLKGKVVVVDFWATWCGPCVAEMPHMKQLYAEYRGKGVEFLGISLDQPKEQGGLDSLKKYVKDNGIAWPQYYQGKGWEGEFSRSWGINSIPAMFVVDTEGKLNSVEARGKLEQIIPKLLKEKADRAKTPAAGG
jgi:thiol-disulfide isomerase/thioredoxin